MFPNEMDQAVMVALLLRDASSGAHSIYYDIVEHIYDNSEAKKSQSA